MAEQSTNKKHTFVIVFGIVLYLLLIISLGLFLWVVNNYKNKHSVDNTNYIPTVWVPTQYYEMTPEEIAYKLQQDTGLTVESLLAAPATKEYIDSFEKAYSAAQAMYYLNYAQKSLDLYSLADTYESDNKTYEFYLDYAGAAQTADNKEELNRQVLAAKKSINSDQSLSDSEKEELINNIDEKIN